MGKWKENHMKKINRLSPLGDINADLLYWCNEFIAHKFIELAKKHQNKEIDDVIALKNKILSSPSIKDLKDNANIAVRKKLNSLSKSITGTVKFYEYVVANAKQMIEIDHNLIIDYRKSLKYQESTKDNYTKVLKELISSIENQNADNHKFGILFDDMKLKKTHKSTRDCLDDEQFKRFNKIITKYNYENEYIKARDILIIRFIMLCGLNVNDLLSLKLNDNIAFNQKEMYLNLENRVKRFDMPRKHFSTQLNKYMSLKRKSETLFYDVDLKYIKDLIAKLLNFAKIEVKEKDAKMLIKSLAVFLYNNRKDGQQIVLNTIQDLLGYARLDYVKDLIGFHKQELIKVTHVLENDLL